MMMVTGVMVPVMQDALLMLQGLLSQAARRTSDQRTSGRFYELRSLTVSHSLTTSLRAVQRLPLAKLMLMMMLMNIFMPLLRMILTGQMSVRKLVMLMMVLLREMMMMMMIMRRSIKAPRPEQESPWCFLVWVLRPCLRGCLLVQGSSVTPHA